MKSNASPALKLAAYIFIVIGICLVAFPVYMVFVTAFKTTEESAISFFALPSSFYLGNFIEVMSDKNFYHYFINSIGITLGSVGIIAVYIPMVGYAISRNQKSNRYFKFLYMYLVLGIFIPFQVFMIPLTQMMTSLKMLNQFGLIMLYVTFGLCEGVFLFVAYLKSVPLEIEEAAYIDGCSTLQIFFRIVYPIAKPMTATIAILDTLWIWNDFLLPVLILNRSAESWTLPLYQYNFKSAHLFRYNLAFAAFMFSIVPMMIIYVFLQKHIIEGLTAGAIKT